MGRRKKSKIFFPVLPPTEHPMTRSGCENDLITYTSMC